MRFVEPGPLRGTVAAPPSKSSAQRAIALAALAGGESALLMDGTCEDVEAAIRISEGLGAVVMREPGLLRVRGGRIHAGGEIDCGESGLGLRMFCMVAALAEGETRLRAAGSLAQRPVGMVARPLAALGASCAHEGGFPPVTVRGPLAGGRAVVDGSTTSQHISGLLIALPLAPRASRLEVRCAASVPYLRLTVEMVRRFGGEIDDSCAPFSYSIPGGQRYSPGRIEIEGDWSGAAALLVAGAIGGEVTVTGIDPQSAQADSAVLAALEAAGARVRRIVRGVLAGKGRLRGFDFDMRECPDLFPPLAALAAHCEGKSRLAGVTRLAGKESERGAALARLLGGLGASAEIRGDVMEIGGGPVAGGRAETLGDHRIAMAAALLALGARGPVALDDERCVGKSFPGFFDALESLREDRK